MNKIILNLTTFTLLVLVGCTQTEKGIILLPYDPGTGISPTQPISGSPANTTAYKTFLDGQVTKSYTSSDLYLFKMDSYLYYNSERAMRDVLTSMNTQFQTPFDLNEFADHIHIPFTPYTGQTISLATDHPELTQYFLSSQISILNTYFNNMFNATDGATATSYYNSATSSVTNNVRFSPEQRNVVQVILDTANKFAQGYFSGKYNYIIGDINTEAKTTGGGCKMSFRNIWMSAVIGGAGGAIYGGITGATAGTFTVPVLGTAVGGIGGAVFGFASGFAVGTVEGVVQEYLQNCLFSNVHTQPDYRCEQFEYSINNLDECIDHKLWFLMTQIID